MELPTYGDDTPLFPEADPEVVVHVCTYIRNVFLLAGMTLPEIKRRRTFHVSLFPCARLIWQYICCMETKRDRIRCVFG